MTAAGGRPLVLASGSPRRRELLERLGVVCEVVPAGVDETVSAAEAPDAYARRIAEAKALAVHGRRRGHLVLAADTVVTVDGQVLGKPEGDSHAMAMLRQLSGRRHTVYTAVALADDRAVVSRLDAATVTFVELREAVIEWYVATGEPADKAGAYAVQGAGGLLVESLDGSPHTVIGLPVHCLPTLFDQLGYDLLKMMDGARARSSLLDEHGIPEV